MPLDPCQLPILRLMRSDERAARYYLDNLAGELGLVQLRFIALHGLRIGLSRVGQWPSVEPILVRVPGPCGSPAALLHGTWPAPLLPCAGPRAQQYGTGACTPPSAACSPPGCTPHPSCCSLAAQRGALRRAWRRWALTTCPRMCGPMERRTGRCTAPPCACEACWAPSPSNLHARVPLTQGGRCSAPPTNPFAAPMQLVGQLPLHCRMPAEAIVLDMYSATRPRCYGLCPMLDYITRPGCRLSVSLGAVGRLPCAGRRQGLHRPALLHPVAGSAAGSLTVECVLLCGCRGGRLLGAWPLLSCRDIMAANDLDGCSSRLHPALLPLQEEEWEALRTHMAAVVLAR